MGDRYKYIIFDFDGVLAETNEIRAEGFRELFASYPEDLVSKTIAMYKANGGFSRYQVIRYFHAELLGKKISNEEVDRLSSMYSSIVKKQVIAAKPVKGAHEFLKDNASAFDFAVVSGSDQEELRAVCRERAIDGYFITILGSPALKKDNIEKLVMGHGWKKEDCLFVGDSTTDLEASSAAGMDFVGRRSGLVDWPGEYGVRAINDLSELHMHLVKA